MTGLPLHAKPQIVVLQSEASTEDLGVTIEDQCLSGSWSTEEKHLHINVLELKVIKLGFMETEKEIQGRRLAVLSDNSTTLAYQQKLRGYCVESAEQRKARNGRVLKLHFGFTQPQGLQSLR